MLKMIKIGKQTSATFKYIAIDPGCRSGGGTGVALLQPGTLDGIQAITIRPIDNEKKDWSYKIEEVCARYSALIRNLFITGAVSPVHTICGIERPKFFNTWKGAKSANTEALFKLITCYARLWQITVQTGIKCKNIEIIKWKGQLKKEQVKNRIEKRTGRKDFTLDAIDAVGIGIHMFDEEHKRNQG
jgi:hypothetical protein